MTYWVFDLDGTLVDSHSLFFNSLSWVFSHFNRTFTALDSAETLKTPGKEFLQYFKNQFGDHDGHKAYQLFQTRLNSDNSQTPYIEGILDLIHLLDIKGYHKAIWTARERHSAQGVIDFHQMDKKFNPIISSNDVTYCKPHPEALHEIAQHFNCKTEDLIMVGDHDNDMLAAHHVGAKAIRANWLDPQRNPKAISDNEITFNHPHDLINYINKVTS